MTAQEAATNDLTEAEAAVYDRQLRVWGIETQRRLTAARVLVVGMPGLAAEACKNIVLAGVGHVTLMDDTPASEAPPGNFLVPGGYAGTNSVAEVSANTLREMNPLVEVAACAGPPELGRLAGHDVVVMVGQPLPAREAVAAWCREKGVKFFAGACSGGCAHFFADLGAHKYIVSKKVQKDEPPVETSGEMDFCSYSEAMATKWSKLGRRTCKLYPALRVCHDVERDLGRPVTPADMPALRAARTALEGAEGVKAGTVGDDTLEQLAGAEGELPAVCAVVGGILGQELIKAISGKGEPVNNFFFFDIYTGAGMIECMSG